jgi:hypothetical protein
MTEREKIAARCRALAAKTVANGCTEAEALSAAAMLARMLADHNLTFDEVQMRESPFGRHTERHDDAVGERLWKVADGIATLTGAVYWKSRAGVYPFEISFFGFDHEVDVARYLLEICARAMRQEHAKLRRDWGLLNASAQRRKILPFLDGMADRLRERLAAMKPPAPTGKGLVVLRGALIKQGLDLAGIKLDEARARPSRDADETYLDGRRAAERVGLNQGLAGGGQTRGMLR